MDEDRTSLSGTQSNDTIIELSGEASHNQTKDMSDDSKKTDAAAPPLTTQQQRGLLILDLLKLKKRKIGHRRVNEEGEITFKKIQTSWIIGSIQLGIGYAIGSLASKPERDLLMMDFTIVETTSFPKDGSNLTPAHHYSDFKFRAYAPVAFRHFRDLFGIMPADFLVSLCDRPVTQLTNPGASGSIFYVTDDDDFILKTVDHKEAEFLQKLLPGYYMNLNQNPRTLLPKFFGLYCYQCSNKNVRVVVMNNLLPNVKLHERYDLKGSTYKRRASRQERKKSSPTFKDLDYLERHPEGIFLDLETYTALVSTMRRDCRVLESFKIMDYSLLVGVHNVDAAEREELLQGGEAARREKDERAQQGEAGSSRQGTAGLARSKSTKRHRLAAFSSAVDVQGEGGSDGEDAPGGIPAKNSRGERLLLFLGIIDILQSFVLKKKLEHTLKAIVHDGDTVSVHRPGFYAQRFLDFMCNVVFKKIPAPPPLKHTPSKRRGRKTSAAVEKAPPPAKNTAPGQSFEPKDSAPSSVNDPDRYAVSGTSFDPEDGPVPVEVPLSSSANDPDNENRSKYLVPGTSFDPEVAHSSVEIDPDNENGLKYSVPETYFDANEGMVPPETIHFIADDPGRFSAAGSSFDPRKDPLVQETTCMNYSEKREVFAFSSRSSFFNPNNPDVNHPEENGVEERVNVPGGQSKVTWAETQVLELSQIVLETDDAEASLKSPVSWSSVCGSTPTRTEGTPSLTESSPSPTTPFKNLDPVGV